MTWHRSRSIAVKPTTIFLSPKTGEQRLKREKNNNQNKKGKTNTHTHKMSNVHGLFSNKDKDDDDNDDENNRFVGGIGDRGGGRYVGIFDERASHKKKKGHTKHTNTQITSFLVVGKGRSQSVSQSVNTDCFVL